MRILPMRMQRLWDAWDIRVMVLWSLTLQIILISFGGRRKYSRGIWIKVVVWSVYMMADWVAVFSLGKLSDVATFVDSSNSNNDVQNNKLMALWAPLLLLHLGGPDTITAYSIEDVRLYLRHALGLFVHVGLALYVFLRFWTGSINWISLLTLPLFVAGILKYGERSWVLWRTNSAFSKPLLPIRFDNSKDVDALKTKVPSEGMMLALSYLWLQNLAPCLASFSNINHDLISSEVTKIIWGEDGVETAFKFFEVQLGFLYDMFYTKANNIYTEAGCIVRLVSFICLATTLLGFAIIGSDDNSNADTCITYVLLGGAVFLELCALSLLIYSDWSIVWMSKHCKNPFVKCIFQVLAPRVYHGKRWASSLPTLNLLNESLHNAKPAMLHRQISRHSSLEKFKAFTCRKDVDDLNCVKTLVMEEVRLLLQIFIDKNNWHNNFEERGEKALDRHGIAYEDAKWCIVGRSFDISILIWHLATNYCYYLEDDPSQKGSSFCEGSKLISEYMVYLLIVYPNMLGESVSACDLGAIRGYCAEMMQDTYRKKGSSHDEAEVCRRMFNWEPNVCTIKYSGSSIRQSLEYGRVPIDARELARTLRTDEYKDSKWEIISQVWAEMLFHGAVKCKYESHIRQLKRGGEFISQVWILLFMHGLIDGSPRDELRPLFKCAIKDKPDSPMEREENGSEEDDEIYGGTLSDEEMDASRLEEGLMKQVNS